MRRRRGESDGGLAAEKGGRGGRGEAGEGGLFVVWVEGWGFTASRMPTLPNGLSRGWLCGGRGGISVGCEGYFLCIGCDYRVLGQCDGGAGDSDDC